MRIKKVLSLSALTLFGGWAVAYLQFPIKRFLWERHDFVMSTEQVSFFGASSAEDAAISLMTYWVDAPMLCLGLWDHEPAPLAKLPDWVEFELPKVQSGFYNTWFDDSSAKITERKEVKDWPGEAWYMVIEGKDNHQRELRAKCLVYREWSGRWKIFYPELKDLTTDWAADFNMES
jgi:hypothetical protein